MSQPASPGLEPTLALPLGRSAISRDAGARARRGHLDALLREDRTAVVVVAAPHVRTLGLEALDLRPSAEFDGRQGEWFYLGSDEDRAYVAFASSDAEREMAEGEWSSLRDAGHLLSDAQAGLATSAVALASWRSHHTHCPRCGAATVLVESGWAARCESDGSMHYPRTDPAVIMAIRDGHDRLLLARSAAWPINRRSVLAGFVEAGEGLEQAVRREVAEEVGIDVGDLTYRGAQPWPFPASLMIAFHGWVEGAPLNRIPGPPPRPDGVEITHAEWFTRQELAQAVAGGAIGLPMRTSIARVLIEDWYGGPIAEPEPEPES